MLVDGLVDRGHEVTLIGAGEQRTQGEFRATYDAPQSERVGENMAELTHAARVDAMLQDMDLDIIHDHSAAGGAVARGRAAPVVITSHGPATGDWAQYLESVDATVELVAISESQKRLRPELGWRAVIHNALDTSGIPLVEKKADHLVWLGRMSPDKGAHLAIEVSRKAGRPIVLAAKCTEAEEQAYFQEFVEPRLGPDVEWLGEVGPQRKYELLGEAAGFLFPLQWEEPFGMVMIEAMACGTPVLALDRGAVPEIVVDGVTGYICSRPEELVAAIAQLDRIDPAACRSRVEDRFSPTRMVEGYERLFTELAASPPRRDRWSPTHAH
jgi:glycosyltransferase involved in cell wall biosynthesis